MTNQPTLPLRRARVCAVVYLLMLLPAILFGQSQQYTRTFNAYPGGNVIIDQENAFQTESRIDRRDIVDYTQGLPDEEERLIITAVAPGTAIITVHSLNEQGIVRTDVEPRTYRIIVRNPTLADRDEQANREAQLIKQIAQAPSLEIGFAGDLAATTIVLKGEMEDDLTVSRVLNIAQAFYPGRVLNFMTVRDPIQIRLKMQVLQVTHNKDEEVGVEHQTQIPINSVDLVRGGLLETGEAFFNIWDRTASGTFTSVINLDKLTTRIKVLQEPTITVLNGQSANFLVGDSIPYGTPIFDDDGNLIGFSVEYVQVGIGFTITPLSEGPPAGLVQGSSINLPTGGGSGSMTFNNTTTGNSTRNTGAAQTDSINSITPTVDANGLIRLYVRPELRRFLGFETIGELPGGGTFSAPRTDVRYVESRVALRNHESLIVGGLFDESFRNELEEVPFISKLPILGELFKNRENEEQRVELVFILTPEIIGREKLVAGDRPQPKLSEMAQHLLQNDIEVYGLKPTRISAGDVLIRQPEFKGPTLRFGLPERNENGEPAIRNIEELELKEAAPSEAPAATPPQAEDKSPASNQKEG